MRRIFLGALAAGAILFLLIQFIRPSIPDLPAAAEINAPEQVKAVLRKDCYSCHSNERRLAWFDQVQPAFSLVRHDVLEARSHLNFSTIGAEPEAAQKGTLYEAVAMMQMGAMPLSPYTQLHPEAKVTAEDLETLKEYLSPWSSSIPQATADGSADAVSPPAHTLAAQPSPNGLQYDGSWEGWKLLAVTDRGDNRQFRIIFGNDVALKAAREGNVHPWPDGSRFAKAAWLQQQTSDGLIVPGKFWQVELMVKGAATYRDANGWGWGRWRGTDLKPYGKDATVTRECTSCHLPVRGNDSVYTEPLSTASVSGQEVLNDAAANLPKDLPFDPLAGKPVSLYIDPRAHTISVLFASDTLAFATPAMPANSSEFALVTWTERDDPHWFGARIADQIVAVEVVRSSPGVPPEYRRYAGAAAVAPIQTPADRAQLIAGLRPVPLP